jgi:hypothetical protein
MNSSRVTYSSSKAPPRFRVPSASVARAVCGRGASCRDPFLVVPVSLARAVCVRGASCCEPFLVVPASVARAVCVRGASCCEPFLVVPASVARAVTNHPANVSRGTIRTVDIDMRRRLALTRAVAGTPCEKSVESLWKVGLFRWRKLRSKKETLVFSTGSPPVFHRFSTGFPPLKTKHLLSATRYGMLRCASYLT